MKHSLEQLRAVPVDINNPCGRICQPGAEYCIVQSQVVELTNIIGADQPDKVTAASKVVCSSLVELAGSLDDGPDLDPMTGLMRKESGAALLPHQLNTLKERAESEASSVAVAFVDLDGFKAVNDNLGHDEGDILLEKVGQLIRNTIREGDFAARWGGDEFVLAGLVDAGGAARFAERVLEAITIDYKGYPISGSIGAVTVPKDLQVTKTIADALVKVADQAMYQAKQAGKSRYVVFGAPG